MHNNQTNMNIMAKRISKVIKRLRCEQISAIEYAAAAMICFLTCLATIVWQTNSVASLKPADQVAVSASGTTSSPMLTEGSILSSPTNVSGLNAFTVASSLCIAVLGFSYIRQSRFLRQSQEQNLRQVKFLQKQSSALKKIIDKRNFIHKKVRNGWTKIGFGDGTVEPVMSRNVLTLTQSDTVKDAIEQLEANGYQQAIVVDEYNRLVGVVSQKDVLTKEPDCLIGDVMSSNLKTASPEMDLRLALSIFLQQRISFLPVVQDEQPVGVLSTSDLLTVLQCLLVSLKEKDDYRNDVNQLSMAVAMRKDAQDLCSVAP